MEPSFSSSSSPPPPHLSHFSSPRCSSLASPSLNPSCSPSSSLPLQTLKEHFKHPILTNQEDTSTSPTRLYVSYKPPVAPGDVESIPSEHDFSASSSYANGSGLSPTTCKKDDCDAPPADNINHSYTSNYTTNASLLNTTPSAVTHLTSSFSSISPSTNDSKLTHPTRFDLRCKYSHSTSSQHINLQNNNNHLHHQSNKNYHNNKCGNINSTLRHSVSCTYTGGAGGGGGGNAHNNNNSNHNNINKRHEYVNGPSHHNNYSNSNRSVASTSKTQCSNNPNNNIIINNNNIMNNTGSFFSRTKNNNNGNVVRHSGIHHLQRSHSEHSNDDLVLTDNLNCNSNNNSTNNMVMKDMRVNTTANNTASVRVNSPRPNSSLLVDSLGGLPSSPTMPTFTPRHELLSGGGNGHVCRRRQADEILATCIDSQCAQRTDDAAAVSVVEGEGVTGGEGGIEGSLAELLVGNHFEVLRQFSRPCGGLQRKYSEETDSRNVSALPASAGSSSTGSVRGGGSLLEGGGGCMQLISEGVEEDLHSNTYAHHGQRLSRHRNNNNNFPFSAAEDTDHEGDVLQYGGAGEMVDRVSSSNLKKALSVGSMGNVGGGNNNSMYRTKSIGLGSNSAVSTGVGSMGSCPSNNENTAQLCSGVCVNSGGGGGTGALLAESLLLTQLPSNSNNNNPQLQQQRPSSSLSLLPSSSCSSSSSLSNHNSCGSLSYSPPLLLSSAGQLPSHPHSKKGLARSCTFGSVRDIHTEKEKSTNSSSNSSVGGGGQIAELRRVRFSGEDVWSYYGRGTAPSPSGNSGVSYLSSCDPSLCYSLSMTTLEATSSAPTNSGTDIYSRWEVAPLPDGCSYEASWSQAMLQSLPPFSRCSNNQSVNSPPLPHTAAGGSTVSTLAGFCTPQNNQNINYGLPRQLGFSQRSPSGSARHFHHASPSPSASGSRTSTNNISYVRNNGRCSTPGTPHSNIQRHASAGGGLRPSGCRTTANVCYRNNESSSASSNELSAAMAAMAAAVARMQNSDYKGDTKPGKPRTSSPSTVPAGGATGSTGGGNVATRGSGGLVGRSSSSISETNVAQNAAAILTDVVLHELQQRHQRHVTSASKNASSLSAAGSDIAAGRLNHSSAASYNDNNNLSLNKQLSSSSLSMPGGNTNVGGAAPPGVAGVMEVDGPSSSQMDSPSGHAHSSSSAIHSPSGSASPAAQPCQPASHSSGGVAALSKTFLPILKRNGGWSRHSRNGGGMASPASTTHSKSRTPLGSWTTANLISRLSRCNSSSSSSSSSSACHNGDVPVNSAFGNLARALRHGSSRLPRQNSHGVPNSCSTGNKTPRDSSVCAPTESGSKVHDCMQPSSRKLSSETGSLSCLDTRESLDLYCMLRKGFKDARGAGGNGRDPSTSCLTDANDAVAGVAAASSMNHAHGVGTSNKKVENSGMILSQNNSADDNGDESPSPTASCRSSCWGSRGRYRKSNRNAQFPPGISTSGPVGALPSPSSVLKRTCSRTYTSAQTQVHTPTGGAVLGEMSGNENYGGGHAVHSSSSSSSQQNNSRPQVDVVRKDRRCFTAAAAAFFPNAHQIRLCGSAGGGSSGGRGVGGIDGGVGGNESTNNTQPKQSPTSSPVSSLSSSAIAGVSHSSDMVIAAQNGGRNSSANLLYDLEFGGLRVKLYKKLSAKCHCQFDVWEAEVVQVMHYAGSTNSSRRDKENVSNNTNVFYDKTVNGNENSSACTDKDASSSSPIVAPEDLGKLHLEKVGVGTRFALKLLEVNACEPAKLKYKTHSITAEGRQLKNLYEQMHQGGVVSPNKVDGSVGSGNGGDGEKCNSNRVASNLMPIPKYFWTASGSRKSDGTKVLGVAMELIQGRSLTQILQQLRCPTKQSAALLAIEIALKIVESQQVLVSGLLQPLINWDTKPGNILLELVRSTSGRLHCRRAVIIDLGDALPGPEYWFPTRHRPGETPGYIICTKGYCSPECAVLVFMLASSSRCGGFRKVWYGENAQVERLQEARKQRLPHRWRQWVKEGFLRRTYVGGNQPTPQTSTASSTVSTSGTSLSFQSNNAIVPQNSSCAGAGGVNLNSSTSPPHQLQSIATAATHPAARQNVGSVEDVCNLMPTINNFAGGGVGGGAGSLANSCGTNVTQQNTSNVHHLNNQANNNNNNNNPAAQQPAGMSSAIVASLHQANNNSNSGVNSRCSSAALLSSSRAGGAAADGVVECVNNNNAINSPSNNSNLNKMQQQLQHQNNNNNMRTDRGCWEVNFTEKSVVFSTGLVLAQIFGGPNLLQVVEKDEVRALDLLCEWGFCDTVNFYSGRQNLGAKNLLASTGVFAEEPWRSKVLVLLEGCLAFVPSKRWSFSEVQDYLIKLYEDYVACYNVSKRSGIVNAIQQATNFRVKRS